MRRFRAELRPPPVPKDIIISAHPKGRNRERLVTALLGMGAISRPQAREELGLIHTTKVTGSIPRSIVRRKATDPISQEIVRAGFFPGRKVGDAVEVGTRMPKGTHPHKYFRQGVDQPHITTDVRRVRTELHGKWKGTPLRVYSVEKEDLPRSMHLKFPENTIGHLSRGSKIHFRGFDEIVPALAEAGLMKTVPASSAGYEKAKSRTNPFRVVGRFHEVSDNPQHYSKFSILSKNKIKSANLAQKIAGKRVGVRDEDFALAELLMKQKGIKARLVSIVNPEEAVSKGVVDFAFGHVTSGKTAKEHGLNWNPLFRSSQVAVVHEDALKNRKVTSFLSEMKKKGVLNNL